MRKLLAGLALTGMLIFGAPRKSEAQIYVSPGKYYNRELHYGHIHEPYYTAVSTRNEYGENIPEFEFGVMNDERADIDVAFWPYSHLGVKWVFDDMPVCVSVESYMGDYASDARPRWFIGYKPGDASQEDNFHYSVGVDGIWGRVKGVKADMTMIARRPGGGQWFADLCPAFGRELVSKMGEPTLTDKPTWDLYANAGYTGKGGRTIAGSVNFDEGRFRNASIGYGRGGFSVRGGINERKKPFVAFNYRTAVSVNRRMPR